MPIMLTFFLIDNWPKLCHGSVTLKKCVGCGEILEV